MYSVLCQQRPGLHVYPRGLITGKKSASKQAIVVLIKTSFAFTSF